MLRKEHSRISPWTRQLGILFLALLIPDGAGGSTRYQPSTLPFSAGEHVVYQASWNGIPVATAKIRSRPLWSDGEKLYQVQIRVKTWKYLDLFWKMRDSIESVFEADTFEPRRFVFLQKENRKKTYTQAFYDPRTNKWAVRREKRRKVRQFEFISNNTLDPVSAAYLVRSLDISVGDQLRLNVFGGKSRYRLILDVVAKERIRVRLGTFDAYRVIPRLINISRSGYARRVRQAVAWISADRRRRPLRIISKVFIGSVYIELIKETY